MLTSIKLELEQTKSRLDYYKTKYKDQPCDIHSKWVEIYQSRIRKLEKLFQKENVPTISPLITKSSTHKSSRNQKRKRRKHTRH